MKGFRQTLSWAPLFRFVFGISNNNGRLERERVTPIEARSLGKISDLLLKIEHLSNNNLCHSCAVRVTVNNSNRFQIYGVTRSYSSHPFLRALDIMKKSNS